MALALGYWRRPDLSARSFVITTDEAGTPSRWYRTGDVARWSDDGNLEYLGRADDQIKVLGHRIEPAEVEQALRRHPQVAEAAALAAAHSGAAELIVAVAARGPAPSEEDLRAHLRASLPPAMVPSRILVFERLPVTVSGKLDRAAILARAAERLPAPEETSIEPLLAGKFKEALGVSDIGPNDDFFELGGDSLATVEIALWAREHFGVPLETSALFKCPTIRSLSDKIRALLRFANSASHGHETR